VVAVTADYCRYRWCADTGIAVVRLIGLLQWQRDDDAAKAKQHHTGQGADVTFHNTFPVVVFP